jgi:hypothetical protein
MAAPRLAGRVSSQRIACTALLLGALNFAARVPGSMNFSP